MADFEQEAVRVPSNVMHLLRQSYDTREKALDWLLAIAVSGLLIWMLRAHIAGLMAADPTVDDALADPPEPSQDISTAFPFGGTNTSDRFYTYNMPSSRTYQYRRAPSGTRPPISPSGVPTYDAGDTEAVTGAI